MHRQVRLAIAKADELSVGADGLAPGDQTQRTFDLQNTGKGTINVVSLTTSASPSSALDSDAVNGLQLQLDKCSKPWTRPRGRGVHLPGRGRVRRPSRPVIGSNVVLTNIAELQKTGRRCTSS